MAANHVFEVLDKSGRKIRLTQERWNHIVQEHPQLTDLEELKNTLREPLQIKRSKYDPDSVAWHYRYIKSRKCYLFVAVKYLNGDGFVITAYYVRKIK